MNRVRVEVLKPKDSLLKGELLNLPDVLAKALVLEGVVAIIPAETKVVGPSENKGEQSDTAEALAPKKAKKR